MSKVQYIYTGAWKGYFAGDRSACSSKEWGKIKEARPVRRLNTAVQPPAPKSDPAAREKLKKVARLEQLPDHHMTLRAMVETVAEEAAADAPESKTADASQNFLLEHWAYAKPHLD